MTPIEEDKMAEQRNLMIKPKVDVVVIVQSGEISDE